MYEIIVISRVSDPGPGKQDIRSLDDQGLLHQEWFARNVSGPFNLTVLAGSGSGELLDREDYLRLLELVTSDRYDLVRCEDVGRIVRRIHAHLVCELCEDHETRLISQIDHIDTALPNWRDASIFAAFHHERSNRDTSDRIKRTHRSRFAMGACLRNLPYGWIKPQGAKTDADLMKDPAAERIYAEWFAMLDRDRPASWAEIARWLIPQGVKFTTRTSGVLKDPDAKSVRRLTLNPLLKGIRERNRRKTKRKNNPGKYVSIKAQPHELLVRPVPHLAFFEAEYFDRVIARITAQNGIYRRADDPARDPCSRRPKRQTRYLGQMTECDICLRKFVWGGHGQTDHLMCNGVRLRRCWNGATFDGTVAARRIAAAVHEEIEALKEFDSAFLGLVNEEAARLDDDREKRIDSFTRQLASVRQEKANLLSFIRRGIDDEEIPSLRVELRQLEQNEQATNASLNAAKQEPTHTIDIPAIDEIKRLSRECLADLDVKSEAFARVMRQLVPKVRVFPVRLCDGGRVVLRATFTINLSEILTDPQVRAVLNSPLAKSRTIDLFDRPQRDVFRQRVVAARAEGKTERNIAAELGITQTAAQRAAALQRMMDSLGLTDPYVRILEPPSDDTKLRGHLHPDYRFEPLPQADPS